MGKQSKENKTPKNAVKKCVTPQPSEVLSQSISKEDYVELQAEAYYRALKRIEEEKKQPEKTSVAKDSPSPKPSFKERFLNFAAVLCFFVFPFHPSKRLSLNAYTPQGFLSFVASLLLSILGLIIWLCGAVMIIIGIYNGIDISKPISVGFILLMVGAFTYLAGSKSQEMKDETIMYAFSSTVFSMFGILVAVITTLK